MRVLLWVRTEVPSVDFMSANGESIEILHAGDLRDGLCHGTTRSKFLYLCFLREGAEWRRRAHVRGRAQIKLAFRIHIPICVCVQVGFGLPISVSICVGVSIGIGIGIGVSISISISIDHVNVRLPDSIFILLFLLLGLSIRCLALQRTVRNGRRRCG